MEIEGIEIHFDEDEGHLRLDCGEQEFEHIRDLVVSRASATDRLGPFVDAIRSIVVRRRAALRDTTPVRRARLFRILLISLALSASLAIQVVGLVAIARWLGGHGH
jgi:hypothetical protein